MTANLLLAAILQTVFQFIVLQITMFKNSRNILKCIVVLFTASIQFSFGQQTKTHQCNVEFYLLKRRVPNIDNGNKYAREFKVNKEDLEDSAFLTTFDINSYSIELFRDLLHDSTKIVLGHKFNLTRSGINKMEKVTIPLSTGRQFALVVNKQVIYVGYFWSIISSFYCDWITAVYWKEEFAIYIDLSRSKNMGINKNTKLTELPLFDCQ